MITSDQIRAARALLNWTRSDLAEKSGIGMSALMRMEGSQGIPRGNLKTMESVIAAFEKAGIEFTGSPESGAGVRWKI